MDWLQKHVIKLCDGKKPSSQGPYTIPYLLKAKEGWTQHYVKGLDRELKPVVFVPKVNISYHNQASLPLTLRGW